MTSLSAQIANWMYLLPLKTRAFNNKHPEERIVAAAASKGIRKEINQEVMRGAQWVSSKRAVLFLTDKRLVSGSWSIDLQKITEACLSRFSTLFGKGLVLKIMTEDGEHYQFGLQNDQRWVDQAVLPLTVEDTKLRYSPFSIVVRAALLIYLAQWTFTYFTRGQ